MMLIKSLLRAFFHGINKIQSWVDESDKSEVPDLLQPDLQRNTITGKNEGFRVDDKERGPVRATRHHIINVWDYLTFKEGTQAHHVTRVLDFEEWIPMNEILHRVNELFGITYQNERSLYPYMKTLVDAGLLEANMVGGKMRWRKKNLLISVSDEMGEEETPPSRTQTARKDLTFS